MTKLRNRYPKDIACELCFSRVFHATEEYILGLFFLFLFILFSINHTQRRQSEYCSCRQFLEWKLQVDLTVQQVYSE